MYCPRQDSFRGQEDSTEAAAHPAEQITGVAVAPGRQNRQQGGQEEEDAGARFLIYGRLSII